MYRELIRLKSLIALLLVLLLPWLAACSAREASSVQAPPEGRLSPESQQPPERGFDNSPSDVALPVGVRPVEGAGLYYFNSVDRSYCKFVSEFHFLTCRQDPALGLNSGGEPLAALPANYTDDALCNCGNAINPGPGIYPAGLFSAEGGVMLSDGAQSYCTFDSFVHLENCANDPAMDLPPGSPTSVNALPSGMQSNGSCQCGGISDSYPPGLFQVGGSILYSNGTRYCGFLSTPHLIACLNDPSLDFTSTGPAYLRPFLPLKMPFDGACGCGN